MAELFKAFMTTFFDERNLQETLDYFWTLYFVTAHSSKFQFNLDHLVTEHHDELVSRFKYLPFQYQTMYQNVLQGKLITVEQLVKNRKLAIRKAFDEDTANKYDLKRPNLKLIIDLVDQELSQKFIFYDEIEFLENVTAIVLQLSMSSHWNDKKPFIKEDLSTWF